MSSSYSRTASLNEVKATSLASIVDSIPLHDAAPTPKPMTLPAILRQNVPGYKARTAQDRVRQLRKESDARASSSSSGSGSSSGSKSARMGKRKQRRWENANFHGAAHITRPKPSDYSICQMNQVPSFPSPPPSTFYPYRPSSSSDSSNPSSSSSSSNVFDDTKAADFGRFSLPIKGLKRSTRRIVSDGGPGEEIVETVDAQIRDWLDGTHVFLNPNDSAPSSSSGAVILDLEGHGQASSDDPTITQISRLPHSIIWSIQDPFVRFLVHAIARYYRVVSFTKSDPSSSAEASASSERKLVYLLRPNMPARTLDPASMPKKGLDTPPSTEWEASSSAGMSETDDLLSSSSVAETASLLSSDDADGESFIDSSEGDSVIGDLEETEGDETVQAISVQDLSLTAEGNQPIHRARPAARLSSYLARPSLPDIDSDSGAEVEYSTEDDDEDESEDSASILSESVTEEPSLRTSAAHIPMQSGAGAHRHALLRQTLQAQHDEGDTAVSTTPAVVVPKDILPSAKTINNARSKTGQGRPGGGWRMPEATFSEWVMAR